MSGKLIIRKSETAFHLLNGIACVFKNSQSNARRLENIFKSKLCEDLNLLAVRKPKEIVEIKRVASGSDEEKLQKGSQLLGVIPDSKNDSSYNIQIIKRKSIADNPLVVGPRYQSNEIDIWFPYFLGYNTSGIQAVGISNKGIHTAKRLYHSKWLKSYRISGRFGIATDTHFISGKIGEKSTYDRIKPFMLENLLNSYQSKHFKSMIQASGLPLDSPQTYELASQGALRPAEKSESAIYSLKCVNFNLPDFEIEAQVINETETYLKTLIHYLGLRLHSTAVCTKIRCIKYGPFDLNLALLQKHWNLQNIMNNISSCKEILNKHNTYIRDPIVTQNELPISSNDLIKNVPEEDKYIKFES